MKYAIIENQVVVNVVVSSAEYATEQGWIECFNAGIGWGYVNDQFVKPIFQKPIVPITPTREQLMIEIAALTAKIEALP